MACTPQYAANQTRAVTPGTATAARIRSGKLQIQDPVTGLFYDLVVRSQHGAPQPSLEGEGDADERACE